MAGAVRRPALNRGPVRIKSVELVGSAGGTRAHRKSPSAHVLAIPQRAAERFFGMVVTGAGRSGLPELVAAGRLAVEGAEKRPLPPPSQLSNWGLQVRLIQEMESSFRLAQRDSQA